MGLTLFYELRLPPETARTDVERLLGALRDRASLTAAAHVSPLFDLSIDTDAEPDDAGSTRPFVQFYAECLSDPLPDDGDEVVQYFGDPRSALGFTVDPGRGSETATFGLMRRQPRSGGTEEWFWWCACKTQYASVEGDEHFIKVHTSLVAILDAAVELGFTVTADDETGYWESRSTQVLLHSVGDMNRIIAKLAGAMSDAIGDEHEVVAPIFEHPEFERLEMEQ